MIKAVKVKLYPTKQQEILMFKSCGAARFAYNWALSLINKNYEKNKEIFKNRRFKKTIY